MITQLFSIVVLVALAFITSSCASMGGGANDGNYTFSDEEALEKLAQEEAEKLKQEEELSAQNVEVVDPKDESSKDLLTVISSDMTWSQYYGMEERVKKELSLMADQGFIDSMFTEAPKYLHYITAKVQERGMPIELVLLPGVESLFKPYAYSYAHAAGMWQIIPDTGSRLGLNINWWHDGRRDVIESTKAALDYLESLAERLDGDYLLALASYNAGIGRIKQAQARNEKKGVQTDYWSLRLPRQTLRYVPRLIALSMIVSNPSRYGVTIPPVPNEPYFVAIKTREQIDLQHFAQAIDLPFDEFIVLNPSYNQRLTDPATQHNILVPLDKERKALSYIEKGDHLSENWITHKVERGQTLNDVAQRFNTTVERLRSFNKLAKSDYIKEGKFLLVPVNREGLDQYLAYHSSAPDKEIRTQNSNLMHKLVRGDSLWGLSRKYNVSINDLMKWNGISSKTRLYAGKKLIVRKAVYRPSVEPIVLNPEYEHRVVRRVLYPVRKGDSLRSISDKFSVSSDEIIHWNPEIASRGLRRGKTLELYVDITKTY